MKRKQFFTQTNRDGRFGKTKSLQYPFEIKGSKYHFMIDTGKEPLAIDRVSNVETGWFVCNRAQVELIENNPEYLANLETQIEKCLGMFGEIKDLPEEGRYFLRVKDWYAREFMETFGKKIDEFWYNWFDLGLNVVYFDKFICPMEGESTHEAIARQYGENAVELVEKIVKNGVHGYEGDWAAYQAYCQEKGYE